MYEISYSAIYQKLRELLKAKGPGESLSTAESRFRTFFFSALLLHLRNSRNSNSSADSLLAGKGEFFNIHIKIEH